MAYSAITNAEIDQDSPITQTLMTKYRDNILATKGMVFLASSDASSNATLDFTEFGASLYDAYIFVLSNVIPATDNASLGLRTSSDGGSTFDSGSSDYVYYSAIGKAGQTLSESSSAGTTRLPITEGVSTGAGNDGASGSVLIAGPHLAKTTAVQWDMSYVSGTVAEIFSINKGGGQRTSSADVDAVRFLFSSGNIESGTITMYGMWNAA